MLKGDSIYLRVVEVDDAAKLLIWENNPENWKVSNTEIPFSMHSIHQLIEQQSNIRNSGEIRFIICLNEIETPIGTIDLYDVNFKHGYATVGIMIAEESERRKGFASESLQLISEYARDILDLTNLQCTIHGDNERSIALFEQVGFMRVGIRKNWLKFKGKRIDEISYQLCLKEM
ncbi:MAG: GNAT family N-acetyltransferase [Bacteroidetes bacterium]|nr:GNAT family N-acetyltransferase [Bacteroidota bacterium]